MTTITGKDATAVFQLAQDEIANGAFERAALRLREVSARLPTPAEQCRCAELMLAARSDEDATALAVRIAREHPDAWPWCWQFAGHVRAKGNLDSSRGVLDAVREAATEPGVRLRAELGLALDLPAVYTSIEELCARREQYTRQLAQFVATHPPREIARSAGSADDLRWMNFFLAYQGGDDRALQMQFGNWLSATLNTLLPECAHPVQTAARVRPRLAFVSSSFHRCTVGFYFAAWIEYLAQRNWEVVLVHVDARRDALSERLARITHAVISLTSDVATNARQLREVAADIIVYPELGMDRNVFALAALRLAKVQVCAWGHPVTTGLPSIDVFLSCAAMEPDNAQQHYSERLIALPGLGTRYLSPRIPDAATCAQLGLPESRPLYLVPQALFKLHPDHDEVLVEILRRDPAALFVLFELRAPSGVLRVRERLLRSLAAASANPGEHLHWFAECSRQDYLLINRSCAVMIDSLHWSGGNATLDALHCGLPVVTCPGRFMRGRQSAAMLRAIDCAELIAATPAQLAEIAVAIAHDRARRAQLAQKITANLPQLTQSDAPLQVLDQALRELLVASATA
jgi:predicted O-linked N-acetylglucosamine transferase (SPINDLY family)